MTDQAFLYLQSRILKKYIKTCCCSSKLELDEKIRTFILHNCRQLRLHYEITEQITYNNQNEQNKRSETQDGISKHDVEVFSE